MTLSLTKPYKGYRYKTHEERIEANRERTRQCMLRLREIKRGFRPPMHRKRRVRLIEARILRQASDREGS